MSQVLVSVIILAHNAVSTIGMQLDALANQVDAPSFEVIVVDNRSTDGLAEFLAHGWEDLDIQLVNAGDRAGAAYARNCGMAHARGDQWLFCDADDVVGQRWVAEASAALDRFPVFSGPGLYVGDHELDRGLDAAWSYLDRHLPAGAQAYESGYADWPILVGNNSGLRRSTAQAVRGYDAGLGQGAEDNDLAVRLQEAGFQIAAAPRARILYRQRNTPSAVFQQRYRAGREHMGLCQRYDLWSRSPHLNGGRWRIEPLRALAAAAVMTLRPGRRDYPAVLGRLATSLGMWAGWVRYCVARRLPRRLIGVGFTDTGSDRSASHGRRRAIVFHPSLLPGGGAERYAVAMAQSLHALGYQVWLASMSDDRHAVEDFYGIQLGDIQLLKLPAVTTRRLPQALLNLCEDALWYRTMARVHADLFVNCLYRSELPGVGAHNLYICHFPHQLTVPVEGIARKAYMQAVRGARRLAWGRKAGFPESYDMVCANSGFTAAHVQQRWGITPEILYPSCDQIDEPGIAKQRRIIAVGRIEAPVKGVPNKRLDVMVTAFAAMTDLHAQGWTLDIVGACAGAGQEYLDHLRELAGHAPVVFHTNVSYHELRELYAGAMIYWHAQGFGEDAENLPQTQEHFGITTVEAMSAGCIPVVIDTAGPREVVLPVDGAERWSTIPELGAATRRVAGLAPQVADELSQRCRDRAHDYDHDHFTARLDAIVKNATSSRNTAE